MGRGSPRCGSRSTAKQAPELNKHQQRWIVDADRVHADAVLTMVEDHLLDRYASESELSDALAPHPTVHIKNLPSLH